jgi:hypothetical protein
MTSQKTPITGTASKAAFTHVMDNIIQNPNITSALQSHDIEDILKFLILTDTDVDTLTYPDPDTKVTIVHALKKGEIGLRKTFIHFVYYWSEIGNPINDQWLASTQAEFDQFHVNLNYTRHCGLLSNIPTTAVPTPALSVPSIMVQNTLSPADMFKRGIKWDPSVFPTLKDALLNDQWSVASYLFQSSKGTRCKRCSLSCLQT